MDFENLHQILRSLYDEMMPLCEDMAGVAKGIAGLGALFYVAYRVWQSLARAEPIDVFPMLRPFAIGLCIMFFPTVVLGTLSGVLSPMCRHGPDAGGGDTGHERVPGAEGQTGIRGDGTQPRNRLPRVQRGI